MTVPPSRIYYLIKGYQYEERRAETGGVIGRPTQDIDPAFSGPAKVSYVSPPGITAVGVVSTASVASTDGDGGARPISKTTL